MLIQPHHLTDQTLSNLLWSYYLEKHHRLPTLFELVEQDKISVYQFWKELPQVWTNSEQTEVDANLRWFYKIINSIGLSQRPKSYQPFTKTVTVYRGGDASEIEQPSWSTSRSVGMKFLFYFPNQQPTLFKGKVEPDNIIFYSNTRKEKEVIVKRQSVKLISAHYYDWPNEKLKSSVALRTLCQNGQLDNYKVSAISAKQFGHIDNAIKVSEEALEFLKPLGVKSLIQHWEQRLAAYRSV